jgi:hypothetical protein
LTSHPILDALNRQRQAQRDQSATVLLSRAVLVAGHSGEGDERANISGLHAVSGRAEFYSGFGRPIFKSRAVFVSDGCDLNRPTAHNLTP